MNSYAYTFHEHITAPRPSWQENRRAYFARILNRLLPGDMVTLCDLEIERTWQLGKQRTYYIGIFAHKHSQKKVIDMLIEREGKGL